MDVILILMFWAFMMQKSSTQIDGWNNNKSHNTHHSFFCTSDLHNDPAFYSEESERLSNLPISSLADLNAHGFLTTQYCFEKTLL